MFAHPFNPFLIESPMPNTSPKQAPNRSRLGSFSADSAISPASKCDRPRRTSADNKQFRRLPRSPRQTRKQTNPRACRSQSSSVLRWSRHAGNKHPQITIRRIDIGELFLIELDVARKEARPLHPASTAGDANAGGEREDNPG